jgi:hypothetical protein
MRYKLLPIGKRILGMRQASGPKPPPPPPGLSDAARQQLLKSLNLIGHANEPHLVFLLDAADDGWNTFQIFGGQHWYFYGCEVTRL